MTIDKLHLVWAPPDTNHISCCFLAVPCLKSMLVLDAI